jgi:hypothetical protein
MSTTSASGRSRRRGSAVAAGRPAGRTDATAQEDLRLACLHLRLGMLRAARAELEDLGRRGALDLAGLAALAEARWRDADLDAAAEAARAHFDGGGSDPVALVVAAEAQAAAGRPAEAQVLVERAGSIDAVALDALFAGVPRRAFWPAAATSGRVESAAATAAAPGPAGDRPRTAASTATAGPVGGLWDAQELAAGPPPASASRAGRASTRAWVEPAREKGHANPQAELVAAQAELARAPERGLLRLALVLRLDPTLAPEVLEATRLRREPLARVVRGDAQRLLGRSLEAEAEFAEAAELIERDAIAHAHSAGARAPREDS